MMELRSAQAEWKGDLRNGGGTLKTESGAVDTKYTFAARFEEGPETNPEELIGAAHAGCFSMALPNILAEAGHTPTSVRPTARVKLEMLESGPTITEIELRTRGEVPGLDAEEFLKHAEAAKAGCPRCRGR